MDGKQLKNSILQWAIQGKLVPQNPKDEPAQKLLEKIALSRHSERSEESSKRSKKTSKNPTSRIYCENGVWYEQVGTATPKDISDEIPFEIPENWAWCRLKDIVKQISAGGDKPEKCVKTPTEECNIPIYSNGETNEGLYGYTNVARIFEPSLTVSGRGTIGYTCVRRTPYVPIVRLITIIPTEIVTLEYLQKALSVLIVQAAGIGTSIPQLTVPMLAPQLFPLPPLAEQKRIVAKLEQVLPLAEEYGAAQEQLDKLNKELPETLKKSILQEAIQGKLVPQNPKDEPASVLLAKIRKEKEILVKQGLLKRNALEEIPIDEDGKLFDLPESWEWCNFSMIAETALGKTKSPHKDKGSPLKYLCSINVYWDEIRLNTVKEMPFNEQEKVKYAVRKGDLLICEGGECGRAAIWDKDEETLYQNALHRVRFYKGIDARFFMHCLFFYKNTNLLDEHIKGETIKHLVQNELDSIVFPLPPLAEQKRIVAKLEELFKVL